MLLCSIIKTKSKLLCMIYLNVHKYWHIEAVCYYLDSYRSIPDTCQQLRRQSYGQRTERHKKKLTEQSHRTIQQLFQTLYEESLQEYNCVIIDCIVIAVLRRFYYL